MTKPVVLRQRAAQDVQDAVDHYRREAGDAVAVGFVDRLEACLRAISELPALGSLRYAHELDLPALRVVPLRGYPYLLFYVEQTERVDVWRVLHAQADIPAWLTGD